MSKQLTENDIPPELMGMLPDLRGGHKYIYVVRLEDIFYLFKPLKWDEFKYFAELAKTDELVPDLICERAVLYPSPLPEDVLAGVPDTLAKTIVDCSGFGNIEAFEAAVGVAREEIQQLEHVMVMTICKAFPSYKPHELYDMQFLDLAQLLAMAETMLGAPVEVEGRRPPPPPVEEGYEAYGEQAPRSEILNPNLGVPNFDSDNRELSSA